MKLYGSHLCSNCPAAIEYLQDKEIEFEFVDISNGMPALKEFLAYRDHRTEFDEAKAAGRVGIPCLVDDEDRIYIGDDIYSAV